MSEGPVTDVLKKLRTCAFCPNTCRSSHSREAPLQVESQTPSALALVSLAVLDGRLPLDEGTRKVLARRQAAEESVGHCTYGLDMPRVLDAALAGFEDRPPRATGGSVR